MTLGEKMVENLLFPKLIHDWKNELEAKEVMIVKTDQMLVIIVRNLQITITYADNRWHAWI